MEVQHAHSSLLGSDMAIGDVLTLGGYVFERGGQKIRCVGRQISADISWYQLKRDFLLSQGTRGQQLVPRQIELFTVIKTNYVMVVLKWVTNN